MGLVVRPVRGLGRGALALETAADAIILRVSLGELREAAPGHLVACHLPIEEAAIPFPREETTPPVTKMYLVMIAFLFKFQVSSFKLHASRIPLFNSIPARTNSKLETRNSKLLSGRVPGHATCPRR